MTEAIKIHPLDLAEIVDQRAKEGVLFATQKDLAGTDEILIDGQVYIQDVTVPRKLSGIV